ncbi:MAG: hypothetical protein AAF560_20980 [Acidobacteriota bacterium]
MGRFRAVRCRFGLLAALTLCAGSASATEEQLIVAPGEELTVSAEAGVETLAALGGGPLISTREITAPASGDHWLTTASRDAAGNLSPLRWLRLRVDGAPPAVTLRASLAGALNETNGAPTRSEACPGAADASSISAAPSAGPGAVWVSPRATVTATSCDPLAGTERLVLELDGATRESQTPRFSAELPASAAAGGSLQATARAVDRVGNRSADTALELRVDVTPPTVELTAEPRVTRSDGSIVLAPTSSVRVAVGDAESGPGSTTLRIDGEPVHEGELASPWVHSANWAAGPHLVEVTAVDRVGNLIDPEPLRFMVDAAGPKISWRLTSPGVEGSGPDARNGATYYRAPVTLEAVATDELAGVDRLEAGLETPPEAPLDDASYRTFDGPLELTGDQLTLRAVDRLGNRSEVQAAWSLDNAPPEITLTNVAGGVVSGDEVAEGRELTVVRGAVIELRAVDRAAGLADASYRLEEQSGRIWRGNWWRAPLRPLPESLTLDRVGRLALTVSAVDRLGNATTARWQIIVRRQGGAS